MNDAHFRFAQRIDFHLLLYVERGECVHLVDFQPVICTPGMLLVLRPGQTQRFDMTREWDGWMLLFQPEFLLPEHSRRSVPTLQLLGNLELLPEHFSLSEKERCASPEPSHRCATILKRLIRRGWSTTCCDINCAPCC